MTKSNLKIFLVIILTILIMACINTNTFAANVIQLNVSSNTTNTTTNTANSTTTNTTTNTATTNTTTTNTATNKSVYNNTTSLPKTGENDVYVVSALILVCAVSAIYAYKKIRDYNM